MNSFIPDSSIKGTNIARIPYSREPNLQNRNGFEYRLPPIREEIQRNFFVSTQ